VGGSVRVAYLGHCGINACGQVVHTTAQRSAELAGPALGGPVLLAGLGQPYEASGNIIAQVPEDVVFAGIQSRISRLPSSEGQS